MYWYDYVLDCVLGLSGLVMLLGDCLVVWFVSLVVYWLIVLFMWLYCSVGVRFVVLVCLF